MKSLDIFLTALERVMGFKKGYFNPLICTIDTKFPVIKKTQLEVFCIDGSYKECISTETSSFNSSEVSKEDIIDNMVIKTIENILRFYGL